MANIIKRRSEILLILLAVVLIAAGFQIAIALAGNANTNTSVTIGNATPAFSSGPSDGGSDGTTPTNVGANVTFTATASDSNSDTYYLAICKTDAITAVNSGAPTCASSQTWCVSSSAVAAGSENSCTHQAVTGDAETQAWFAFVCDYNAASACSSSSQGSTSPSPFKVNRAPGFTVYGDSASGGVAPTTTVTFTTTSSDSDTDTASDTVSLYVCKSNDWTGSACGAAGTWCSSLNQASDPTCNASGVAIQDDTYPAYAYIKDSHGFVAAGQQGTNSAIVINNVAPDISSITLVDKSDSGNLTLDTEAADSTGYKVKFTVSDTNGCLTSAGAGNYEFPAANMDINVYRSDVTNTGCDATGEKNGSKCYPMANAAWAAGVSCTLDADTCSNAADTDANFTCTFPFNYYADPTVTNSQYAANSWLTSVQATDDDSAASDWVEGSGGDGSGNEMDFATISNITTTSIAYGSLSPGGDSADKTTVIQATGNTGLDENIYGTDMTSGGNTIGVAQQKSSLSTITDWTTGGLWTHTVTNPTYRQTNVLKSSVTNGLPATVTVHWMLRVPNPQATGSYSGTTTFAAHLGDNPATEWGSD